jgi:hypothetical protein
MPVRELHEEMRYMRPIDFAGLEVGDLRLGVGKILPGGQSALRGKRIDGNHTHGAVLLFPERQRP